MQRRRFAISISVLFAVLLCVPTVRAQTTTSGVLQGTVTDQTGAPLSEVLISVIPVSGGAARSGYTDQDGAYRFLLMQAGRYDLRAEKIGYKPKVTQGVSIAANGRLTVAVSLVETPPPVESADVVRFESAAAGSRAGTTETLSLFDVSAIPLQLREPSELARLAASATPALEIEGLPASFSKVYVDGVPYTAARHPGLSSAPQRELALPLNALSSVDLVAGEPDAEWGGFASGALAMTTRGGSSAVGIRAFGEGGKLQSDIKNIDAAPNSAILGGVLLSGPLIRDTAHYSIAIEARKLETPTPTQWNLDPTATQALIDAGTARGVQLGRYAQPFSPGATIVSGAGRFDWQLGSDYDLSVRGAFGRLTPGADDLQLAAAGIPEAAMSGRDLLLSATVGSVVGTNKALELRLSVGNSTREQSEDAADTLPSTRIISGAAFGIDPRLPGSFRQTDLRAEQSLQIPVGDHEFKAGVVGQRSAHKHDYAAADRVFVFGSTADFVAGSGMFERIANAAPAVSFNTLQAGGYLQDSWQAAPGLTLLAAVRYDAESLPAKDVVSNQQWLVATGVSNAVLPRRVNAVSPRFGLTWDVGGHGRWIVRGSAGRFAQSVDPLLLSQALTEDGDVVVHRQFGNVASWPAAPASDTAAVRLTIISPNYKTPRSDRASFSVSGALGGGTVLMVSGTYRHTNFLPRSTDLNLVAAAGEKDQYGRTLYGTLTQFGELLTSGLSSRRFGGYDVVSGITADGSAEYRALSVGLEHAMASAFGFFARYTYSQATDNWPVRNSLGTAALPTPLADAAQDWREGTSDYDLPHRLAAGLQLRPALALQPRITLIYRYQSGYPFTPGFRPGVDANGDGVANNDPAFVDNAVAGISALTSQWSCLSAGSFAERNSCREASTQNLDVRVGLSLMAGKRTSGELFIEALNLLDNDVERIDHALYLIDGSGSLTRNASTSVVTVPLIANPNFGKPMATFGTGRMLRIGFQVNY